MEKIHELYNKWETVENKKESMLSDGPQSESREDEKSIAELDKQAKELEKELCSALIQKYKELNQNGPVPYSNGDFERDMKLSYKMVIENLEKLSKQQTKTNMEELKKWEQWLIDLFQKISNLFKGKENNYEDDNELLLSIAENDEEKAAIAQICDEIDETNNAFDEVVEAAKNGTDPSDWLTTELQDIANENGETLTKEDIKDAMEKDAKNRAEELAEMMADEEIDSKEFNNEEE